MDWRPQARCLDEDPELFFPDGDSPRYAVQIAAARDVCARCPVATECLDFALRTDQATGVWGGTLPRQRAMMRRRTSPAVAVSS